MVGATGQCNNLPSQCCTTNALNVLAIEEFAHFKSEPFLPSPHKSTWIFVRSCVSLSVYGSISTHTLTQAQSRLSTFLETSCLPELCQGEPCEQNCKTGWTWLRATHVNAEFKAETHKITKHCGQPKATSLIGRRASRKVPNTAGSGGSDRGGMCPPHPYV